MEYWLPGLLALMLLMLSGIPIAFAMAAVGFVGIVVIRNWNPAFSMLAMTSFETGMSYTLSVVPLFILMGNFVTRAGISDELYRASHAWLGHYRGGLAMATVAACGGFSSVCGSSLATAATMGKVAIPSMRRYRYADSLAVGVIAAGGTLGILIPPSVVLVLYGVTTQQDIGLLFIAGLLPGLLGILGYMAAVWISCTINPALGPPAERLPILERVRSLNGLWSVLALFALVIGGIYLGVFTATEAAGIGATGAFLFALLRRRLTWRGLGEILVETAKTTTMMFMVLIGALLFANFINLAGLPRELSAFAGGLEVSPFMVLLGVLLIYLLLGTVLESLSMILLTVPIFAPLILTLDLGIDPALVLIWFGIVVVVVTEISLITPPVGLNVFVLKATLRDVRLSTIFKGVLPFVAADIVRLALLVLFPGLVLALPRLMG